MNAGLPDAVLTLLREAAQQLVVAEWSALTTPCTLTEAVVDLETGYSTYDMAPEQMRAAAMAASALRTLAIVYCCSIAELLELVEMRDELVYERSGTTT